MPDAPSQASSTATVLSIDGGGIRGLIPARLLAAIEKKTGRPIASLFDLIAGTSTGGLLALALTRPDPEDPARPYLRARDIADLYDEEGPRIFSRSLWHRVQSGGNLIDQKYPDDGLEAVLRKYLANTPLSAALTNVLVPAYEIERREAFFFKSHRARQDEARDFLMRAAGRATAAAPTYFEPARVESPTDTYSMVDGGVFAGNPAMCAYVEAKSLFPEAERILLVSLGTGELTRSLPYERVREWGVVEWAQPLLDVVFHGVSDTVDHQLRQILNPKASPPSYYRFQATLDASHGDIDDASRRNLKALRRLARELLRDQGEELQAVCNQLVALRSDTGDTT